MRLHLVMMTYLSKLGHFPLPFSPKQSVFTELREKLSKLDQPEKCCYVSKSY